MLNRYTWALIFIHKDREYEEVEHTTLEGAIEHFNMFDDSDADMYEEIQLNERDWKVDRDKLVMIKTF